MCGVLFYSWEAFRRDERDILIRDEIPFRGVGTRYHLPNEPILLSTSDRGIHSTCACGKVFFCFTFEYEAEELKCLGAASKA